MCGCGCRSGVPACQEAEQQQQPSTVVWEASICFIIASLHIIVFAVQRQVSQLQQRHAESTEPSAFGGPLEGQMAQLMQTQQHQGVSGAL